MLLDPTQLARLLGDRRWRTHFRRDGHPKQALTEATARTARRRGLRTYRCPICQRIHAGSPRPRRRRRPGGVGR